MRLPLNLGASLKSKHVKPFLCVKPLILTGLVIMAIAFAVGCSKTDEEPVQQSYPAIEAAFGAKIDLNNLANYANQPRPGYINKDNTGGNNIIDAKATLGRVLFYDKNLSIDNTVSCASCHKQEFAFSDTGL